MTHRPQAEEPASRPPVGNRPGPPPAHDPWRDGPRWDAMDVWRREASGVGAYLLAVRAGLAPADRTELQRALKLRRALLDALEWARDIDLVRGRHTDEWWGPPPGTTWEEARAAAADRLAARIQWYPWTAQMGRGRARNPRVRDAFRERARDIRASGALGERPTNAEIARFLLAQAIPLVAGRLTEWQRHRTPDGRWMKDGDGRAGRCWRPDHAELVDLWGWFCAQARAAAEADLLGMPYPDGRENDVFVASAVAVDTARLAAVADATDPLLALLDDMGAAELLHSLEATPRQREILALLAIGHDVASIAQTLGIAPATVRVQLKRLRDALAA